MRLHAMYDSAIGTLFIVHERALVMRGVSQKYNVLIES